MRRFEKSRAAPWLGPKIITSIGLHFTMYAHVLMMTPSVLPVCDGPQKMTEVWSRLITMFCGSTMYGVSSVLYGPE